MQSDFPALAEAKALINYIQVTQDPAEQNRLWNRYYRLSDSTFPDAAAFHARYQTLQGAERAQGKAEYMEMVRRMWASVDASAAYPVHLGNMAGPGATPLPSVPNPVHARATQRTPKSRRPSNSGRNLALAGIVVALVCGAGWWAYEKNKAAEQARISEATIEAPIVDHLAERDKPEELPSMEEAEVEIVEELARTILPEFKPVPESLVGKGDRLVRGEAVFDDVYVIESDSQFYVRVPELGSVETVEKEGTELTLGEDPEHRKALLALWKENHAEIDNAAARREKEKVARLAAHFKSREKAREARAEYQDAERWRVKGGEWLALAPEQRDAARMQAYSNWRAVQSDVATVEELYYRIVQGYEIIGITDSRASRLSSAYKNWARELGPNFRIEDALIAYNGDREEVVAEISNWEAEYYRLLEHVNEVYPTCESRVEEIRHLDDALPPEIRMAEATIDWDSALEGDDETAVGGGGGVGTGFIVADGHVMTCAHVVRGGKSIMATSTSGSTYKATVVTMDAANDWALLKVDGLSGPPVPVADDKPNVGATIYCLGYPLGGIRDSADPIVGSGNIAALQRLDGDQRFMQITAPVNPGNSGGPVLDQYGRWVGIVSQKLNDQRTLDTSQTVAQGVNFAVKATFIKPILDPRAGVKLVAYHGNASTPMSLEKITQTVAPSIVRINVE